MKKKMENFKSHFKITDNKDEIRAMCLWYPGFGW